MIRCLTLLLCLTTCIRLFGQQPSPPEMEFNAVLESGGIRFTPVAPPLPKPIAGGREPFYTWFWEFGDGSHSTEARPLHVYQQAGEYEASLTATVHYDDGKSPRRKKKKTTTGSGSAVASSWPGVFDDKKQSVALAVCRDPRPEEELILICSYRNLSKSVTGGNLHLFYNEKSYKTSHFEFVEARTHYGEQVIESVSAAEPTEPDDLAWPRLSEVSVEIDEHIGNLPDNLADDLLAKARKNYRENRQWRFENLTGGASRNMYISLDALPSMLKDTTAVVTMEAIFVPDNPMLPPDYFTLEMEIVGSHDPNLIAVSEKKINYRRLKYENLSYKVRFQNNGEGPAKKIRITIDIPEGLKSAEMRPVEWYPKCPICPKNQPLTSSCLDTVVLKNKIVFTFNNIYLPGSRQADVTDKDSTKGYVKYRIAPQKRMPKYAFRSKAGIVFDNNPPVYTNFTKTRFKKGFSPGLKLGYNFHPDSIQDGYPMAGLSFSPYKSWRVYPQVEVLAGIRQHYLLDEKKGLAVDTFNILAVGSNGTLEKLDSIRRQELVVSSTRSSVSIEIPVLLRKSLTSWVGVGLGGSARVTWWSGKDQNIGTVSWLIRNDFGETLRADKVEFSNETSVSARTIRYTVFAELTLGSVRIGPNLGIRTGYVLGQRRSPFVQGALEWKF